MKILITGTNGMLGSSLCRLYYNQHEVLALHRDPESFAFSTVDFSLDLTDKSKVEELFNQIKPKLVFHCAGLTSLDACETDPNAAFKAHVTATENIAKSLTEVSRLVYISTDQVYGEAEDHSEDIENLLPLNQYGKTKLAGERKVSQFHANHIIVRTNLIGWNVKPCRVSSAEWIYHSLKDRQPITLFTDYTFSPIYADSLGKIILQIVDLDYKGIINVGSREACSKYEFGIMMAEVCDLDHSLISPSSIHEHQLLAKRPASLDLNIEKVLKMGLKIPSWQKSIERFVLSRKTVTKRN